MTQKINRKLFIALYPRCTPYAEVIPNYCDDPRLVVAVMREREDWDEFADIHFIPAITGDGKRMFYISEYLIMDRTGKLAKLATEWLNKQGGAKA